MTSGARTPELEAAVLEGLAEGQGLAAIAKRLGMHRTALRRWENDPDYAARVKGARRQGLEKLAEEILEIGDAVEKSDSMAEVTAARLRVDSRKWLLSKLVPEQYGDKLAVTGSDGRDLIPANHDAAIPRLMQVLAVLLPGTHNRELFRLATEMTRKLKEVEGPKSNSAVDEN